MGREQSETAFGLLIKYRGEASYRPPYDGENTGAEPSSLVHGVDGFYK